MKDFRIIKIDDQESLFDFKEINCPPCGGSENPVGKTLNKVMYLTIRAQKWKT